MLAVIVSGAALSVSLLHAGPQGPVGPPGSAGASANVQSYGVCVSMEWRSTSYVSSVSSPVRSNGILSCPSGDFVPVSPQTIP